MHIFWPPFTFSTPNVAPFLTWIYQLAYGDSKVPKRFVGLNRMQCSPSFDWNWGKQNDPTACLNYPPDCVGGVTRNPKLRGHRGAAPLKFLTCTHYLGQRAAKKQSTFFTHFHGFVADTNYKHLECFVMLGTLSKPRRGQMSHICDISALRVNS